MKPQMTGRTAIIRIVLAALLIAAAGPAMAKQQRSGEVTTTQKQVTIKTKRQAVKYCKRNPPPFMRSPRFMNRGFFKKKCPEQSQ
jgi:hypothetical protein